MDDTEKIERLRKFVQDQLAWLHAFMYEQECNIPEPNEVQAHEYSHPRGERDALMEVLKRLGE